MPTPIVPEKPTYTVQSGTVVRTLEFTGRASPLLEQELFFKADGFVGEVLVERNAWVQAGDVLAELEISGLEFQLAQQRLALQAAEQNLSDSLYLEQIALEQAQIALQEAQLGNSNVANLSAEINLAQAQNAVADAQAAYQQSWDPARDWELYVYGDALVIEREAATDNLAGAQDNLKLAQAEYNATLSSNQASYAALRALELNVATIEFHIEQLERGVDPMLQLQIEDLERQVADARLIAPFDGQVLSIGIDPGDPVSAFSTVMVLADTTELEMTAELNAEQLSDMALGQKAQITLRNRPDETFQGEVRQLPYPYGGGTTGAGDDDPAAHIAIAEDVELEPGELATVIIVLEEKENVLWLPPAAIRTFQGRDFVIVQFDEGQRRVDVLLGIESEERVEIVQGLEEGQIIVGE